MHVVAAIFLLPASVVLYTFVGGIKATFLTDYVHTFIITIIICYFTIKTFTIPEISSIGDMFNLVVAAGERHPVAGNHDGSYLTMASKDASVSQLQSTLGVSLLLTSIIIRPCYLPSFIFCPTSAW